MKKSIILLSIFIGFLLIKERLVDAAQREGGGMPPAKVTVSRVRMQTIKTLSKFVGTVMPSKVSLVSSETAGLIKDIKFEEGSIVAKGQVITVLESSQISIQIKEAEAVLEEERQRFLMLKNGSRPGEIKKAEADMEESKILWKREAQELKRAEDLFKDKIISENEFTKITLGVNALEKSYIQKKEAFSQIKEGARVEEIANQSAKVISKEAYLESLLDKKRKSNIAAPFDGVIVEKFVENGMWVNEGDKIVKLIKTDPIRIDVMVPEDIISEIKIGDEIAVLIDALPGREFKGKVSSVIPEASTSSRTYPVRLLLKNPDNILKSGMTARAVLEYGASKKAVMINNDAIIVSGNTTMVYKAGKDNTAQMVSVKTGQLKDGWIEVSGEIGEGDAVIIKGNERLMPGQAIEVMAD